MTYFWVFLGGGIGSMLRYGIAKQINTDAVSWPWATFIANLLACLCLGVLVALQSKGYLKGNLPILLMTGFCGGFSTFSTFAYESLVLFQNGQTQAALFNIIGSLLFGILGLYVGIKLGGL